MQKWQAAVSRFRRAAGIDGYRPNGGQAAQIPARALFIGCSENASVAALLAAFDPVCMLQNLGGTVPRTPDGSDDQSNAATIDYAIGHLGVTHIVLCGHADCVFATTERPSAPAVASNGFDPTQVHLLTQWQRLTAYLAARHDTASAAVEVTLLWIDEAEGHLCAYAPDTQRFTWLSDLQLAHLVTDLQTSPCDKATSIADNVNPAITGREDVRMPHRAQHPGHLIA